jgi:hypothetical protein
LGGAEIIDPLGPLVVPDGKAADVVVVGLQEMCELNLTNIMFGPEEGDLAMQEDCLRKVSSALEATGEEYEIVKSVGLVGLFLIVYVRKALHPLLDKVVTDRIKTGALNGYLGNKGAVCIRMTLDSWDLCFVNVHLPSGSGNFEARNNTFGEVIQEAFQGVDANGAPRTSDTKPPYSVGNHHASFILGDFNFRLLLRDDEEWPEGNEEDWLRLDELTAERAKQIQAYLPRRINGVTVMKQVEDVANLWVATREYLGSTDRSGLGHRSVKRIDQKLPGYTVFWGGRIKGVAEDEDWIRIDQARGLCEYKEGPVDFHPTYRYLRGQNAVDRKRAPAWTDRVLYKSEAGVTISPVEYRSILEMFKTSDHRPITGLFQVATKEATPHALAHEASRRMKKFRKTFMDRLLSWAQCCSSAEDTTGRVRPVIANY